MSFPVRNILRIHRIALTPIAVFSATYIAAGDCLAEHPDAVRTSAEIVAFAQAHRGHTSNAHKECGADEFTAQQRQGIRIPNELVGDWCAVANPGTRIDIAQSAYEEGDGLCEARHVTTTKGHAATAYRITLSCDLGVEGKKPIQQIETFTVITPDQKRYLVRQGSLYDRSSLTLYERCQD